MDDPWIWLLTGIAGTLVGLTLVALLPLVVGHAIDVRPAVLLGEGDAALYEGDYERKPHYCINQQVLVEHVEGEEGWQEDEVFEECRGILSEYGL